MRKKAESGYTSCACRDCMETVVSEDVTKPELCDDCEDAGCDPTGRSECEKHHAYMHEASIKQALELSKKYTRIQHAMLEQASKPEGLKLHGHNTYYPHTFLLKHLAQLDELIEDGLITEKGKVYRTTDKGDFIADLLEEEKANASMFRRGTSIQARLQLVSHALRCLRSS